MSFFDTPSSNPSVRFTEEQPAVVGVVTRIGTPFQGKGLDGQPEKTAKGNPVYTLPVDLETEAGAQTLYVKGAAMKNAIRDALNAVGLNDLQLGITLGVKRGAKEKTQAGFMAWTYTAKAVLPE